MDSEALLESGLTHPSAVAAGERWQVKWEEAGVEAGSFILQLAISLLIHVSYAALSPWPRDPV